MKLGNRVGLYVTLLRFVDVSRMLVLNIDWLESRDLFNKIRKTNKRPQNRRKISANLQEQRRCPRLVKLTGNIVYIECKFTNERALILSFLTLKLRPTSLLRMIK